MLVAFSGVHYDHDYVHAVHKPELYSIWTDVVF